MDRTQELTTIGKNNMKALYGDLTPAEILKFMENGALYRGFENMVKKVYHNDNVKDILTKKLSDMLDANPDSIRKNVSNWFADKNLPQREQLFQICFALELDCNAADMLLAYASDTGIHFRNPEEIIYAFCLKLGKSYAEAQRLKDELLLKCGDFKNVKRIKNDPVKFTGMLKNELLTRITNEEELESFLVENAESLGELHMAAYIDFLKMLSYLQDPDKDFDDNYYSYMKKHKNEYSEKELETLQKHEAGLSSKSIQQVVEEFMQMHVPENTSKGKGASKKDFTYLQKAIKKNWPSENVIFKMKNRDIDVSRKVMLLLFLLTEEFEVSEPSGSDVDDYWMFDDCGDEEESASERMEIRIRQINLFLESYGMKLLDPGNPFDLIVLYALKAGYEGEDGYMDERMEEVLSELFES